MSNEKSPTPLIDTFATNLRRLRLERKLSQEELAERAGVHRTYVGMLERSEKNVTILNIERIARGLGVSPEILLIRPAE